MIGITRHAQRVREIAVAAMVHETAKSTCSRALNTPTRPSMQERVRQGDLVDYYRKPNQKDISGWHGPAKIISDEGFERGVLTVKINGIEIHVATGDLRPQQAFWSFAAETHPRNHTDRLMITLTQSLSKLRANTLITVCLLNTQGQWKFPDKTSK